MELQKQYIGEEAVGSVYLGGGTPSLLDPGELEQLMEGLRNHFRIDPEAEITLEANPDDIAGDPLLSGEHLLAAAKLKSWKQAGINRLSIGVQSFFEEDLRWMNRAHDAGQALASLRLAQEQGFDNISIDLIYGGPTLPDDHWKNNVEQAILLGIPHLSCYALTVEPRTALDKMIRDKQKTAVDPDAQARQFLFLMDWLGTAGYEHYEISNFALPGKRSLHNSSYWQGKTYLGLGPSAHSFNGTSRQWNIANNARYIDGLLAGRPEPPEREELSSVQQLNEYIMISLRTMEGCDLGFVSRRFGQPAAFDLRKKAERYIKEGKINEEKAGVPGGNTKRQQGSGDTAVNSKLILTREGKLLADGIAADLFF